MGHSSRHPVDAEYVPAQELASAPGTATHGGPQSVGEPGSPWILNAHPGLVVEVPFKLNAAAIELRGADLYVHAGDLLVVIKGYGPALDAGHAPMVVDTAGDSLS